MHYGIGSLTHFLVLLNIVHINKELEVAAGFSCEMGEIIDYWSFSFRWVALGFKFQTLE